MYLHTSGSKDHGPLLLDWSQVLPLSPDGTLSSVCYGDLLTASRNNVAAKRVNSVNSVNSASGGVNLMQLRYNDHKRIMAEDQRYCPASLLPKTYVQI
jgi:hypothetical protein